MTRVFSGCRNQFAPVSGVPLDIAKDGRKSVSYARWVPLNPVW